MVYLTVREREKDAQKWRREEEKKRKKREEEEVKEENRECGLSFLSLFTFSFSSFSSSRFWWWWLFSCETLAETMMQTGEEST